MEAAFGDVSKTFMNASSQTEDFNITLLTRSNSSDMIVDSPIAATMINPETTHATGSTAFIVCRSLRLFTILSSILRHTLDAQYVMLIFFGNSSTLVFSNDIRARAFLEHDIFIPFGSRCCDKHISAGYLKPGALQRIQNKESKGYLSVEEFINIFNTIKNEYLLKVSAMEDFSKNSTIKLR